MPEAKARARFTLVPSWFGRSRVVVVKTVVVECGGTDFRLENQTAIVGGAGVWLPTPVPVHEGAEVRLHLRWPRGRLDRDAAIVHSTKGWGTLFLFRHLPGRLRQLWEALAGVHSTD